MKYLSLIYFIIYRYFVFFCFIYQRHNVHYTCTQSERSNDSKLFYLEFHEKISMNIFVTQPDVKKIIPIS